MELGTALSAERKNQVKRVIKRFSGLFLTDQENFVVGAAKVPEVECVLKDHEPVHVKVRRLPPAHREFVLQETKRMHAWGVIRPSSSEYFSPIVTAENKEKLRLCNDYSLIN